MRTMSDSTHASGSGRSSRPERVPVSCGECRRRKQKCNQGQPCSNCARRFPPPMCEYMTNAHRRSDTDVCHLLTLPPSLLPPAFHGDDLVPVDGVSQPLLSASPSDLLLHEQRHMWPSTGWPQFAETPTPTSPTGWGSHWQGLWTVSFGRDMSPLSSQQAELSTTSSICCQPDCLIHTEAFHAAAVLLTKIIALPAQFVHQWQPDRTDEIFFWLSQQVPFEAVSPSRPTHSVSSLPFQPTRQDADLLRIFVNFISRFKASLDGDPDINTSLYMKQYIPFCLRSPLLIQTSIYTSACFLNETTGGQLFDRTAAMAHKCRAIRMLNEHLQTRGSTTDEAIVGVMQLMLNEWYWGNMGDLKAHLSGLREMVRLRGGFASLGLGGLLARLVIVSDIAIALSFEVPPHLQGGPEFEFRETTAVPFRVFLNTPLVPSLAPFARCAEPLHLHPATAQVLDDMRFLTGLVLALPHEPSEKDLQKVQSTSAWIYDRISSLPADGPAGQSHRGAEERLLSPINAGPSGSSSAARRASSSGAPRRPSSSSASASASSSRQHSPADVYNPAAGYGSFSHPSSPGVAVAPPLPPPPPPQPQPGPGPAYPDIMYQAVREAALIYARAIMHRKPLRDPAVCSQEDFFRLWTTIWRVPLRSWKGVLGVFVWVALSITPASRGTPHERFVKSFLTVGLVQMGLEDWDVAEKGMRGALTLVEWLAGSGGGGPANQHGGEN